MDLAQTDPTLEEDDDAYASSSPPSSTQTSTLTWITWFTSLPGHEYFCEVAEDFIEDDFNLTGLQGMVPFWKEALEMVLDVEPEEEDSLKIPDVSIIESSAELLYGLVHQRYILTRQGLQAMSAKSFGACPRVFCHATPVVPCGRSDQPGLDTVKLYCPNCGDLYAPPSSRFQGVDGAFFGTTFPHLFYQTYRDLFPAAFSPAADHPTTTTSSSASGQQQQQQQPDRPSPSSSSTVDPPPSAGPTAAAPDHDPSSSTPAAAAAAAAAFVNPDPNGGLRRPFGEVYQKRIYGFKVSERARSGPRMEWLRMRPASGAELDRVDWKGRWIGGGGGGPGGGGGGDEGEEGDNGKGELFEGAEDSDEDDDDEEEEEEEDGPAAAGGVSVPGATEAAAAALGREELGSSYPPSKYAYPRALELAHQQQQQQQQLARRSPTSSPAVVVAAAAAAVGPRRRPPSYRPSASYSCPPLLTEAEFDRSFGPLSAGEFTSASSSSADSDGAAVAAGQSSSSSSEDEDEEDEGGCLPPTPGVQTELDNDPDKQQRASSRAAAPDRLRIVSGGDGEGVSEADEPSSPATVAAAKALLLTLALDNNDDDDDGKEAGRRPPPSTIAPLAATAAAAASKTTRLGGPPPTTADRFGLVSALLV